VSRETIFTNTELPGGNRAVLRNMDDGSVQTFVNRPAMVADPEGVVALIGRLHDMNRARLVAA
jgi:hypothetical protein